ncbi:MAG: hypothetical protein KGO49_03715 [Gammaproteobacteria bacterium]|nr:hypothetical protein [Gammaproteobacteria bacterium]
MKNWLFKSFRVILLILLGFVIGSFVGFKAGFYAFYFYDSIPRGALATVQLNALNHNDQRAVRLYLENRC